MEKLKLSQHLIIYSLHIITEQVLKKKHETNQITKASQLLSTPHKRETKHLLG